MLSHPCHVASSITFHRSDGHFACMIGKSVSAESAIYEMDWSRIWPLPRPLCSSHDEDNAFFVAFFILCSLYSFPSIFFSVLSCYFVSELHQLYYNNMVLLGLCNHSTEVRPDFSSSRTHTDATVLITKCGGVQETCVTCGVWKSAVGVRPQFGCNIFYISNPLPNHRFHWTQRYASLHVILLQAYAV